MRPRSFDVPDAALSELPTVAAVLFDRGRTAGRGSRDSELRFVGSTELSRANRFMKEWPVCGRSSQLSRHGHSSLKLRRRSVATEARTDRNPQQNRNRRQDHFVDLYIVHRVMGGHHLDDTTYNSCANHVPYEPKTMVKPCTNRRAACGNHKSQNTCALWKSELVLIFFYAP